MTWIKKRTEIVVFSLQTFINTFFYVQSSGRARRAALAGRPPPDRGSERLLADGHSAPRLEGRSARPSAGRGYQPPPNGLAVHPVDEEKGERLRGAADAGRPDT
jgi:hypothetical protein